MKVEGSNEIATYVKRSGTPEVKRLEDGAGGARKAGDQATGDAIVDLSRRSQEIRLVQRTLKTEPDVRADKVRAAKEKIARGTYEIDVEATAEKILKSSLEETS
ncbi:MAG: flagellar biosynthesis anti-sigma factor FlgM [Deltaproteobacteria bacterium]|nr:flagellar biosynthesis anti-sigma factor FlgM [Deltaproteobacteria bacterium]